MTKTTIIGLLCALQYVSSTPNACCPDNALILNSTCSNGKVGWWKTCNNGAYVVFNDEIQQDSNDKIILMDPHTVIPPDKYCKGSIADQNEEIIMVCFPDVGEMEEGQMGYLEKLICCSISISSLILTLAVYIILPSLRDLQGKCLMSAVFSLLMAFLFLSLTQQNVFEGKTCVAMASLIYFWFLCVFFWLNVVAFNVWRSVVRPKLLSNKKYLFWFYNVYAWTGPIIFLIITVTCNQVSGDHMKPNFGLSTCWFPESKHKWAYFYGPITVLILANIVMFIWTAWTLWKLNKGGSAHKQRSHKFKFYLYLKLSIIMGICWIFEPMSDLLYINGSYIWLATDYINSLQGLLIFLLLVVFRKRVRRDLAKKGTCCNRLPKEWATMPDEECEELEEDIDEVTSTHNNTGQTNRV